MLFTLSLPPLLCPLACTITHMPSSRRHEGMHVAGCIDDRASQPALLPAACLWPPIFPTMRRLRSQSAATMRSVKPWGTLRQPWPPALGTQRSLAALRPHGWRCDWAGAHLPCTRQRPLCGSSCIKYACAALASGHHDQPPPLRCPALLGAACRRRNVRCKTTWLPLYIASHGCLQEGEAAPAGCGVAIVDDLTTVYLSLRCATWGGHKARRWRAVPASQQPRLRRSHACGCAPSKLAG